jgi:uncharacterized membrane protein YbhN (UPF0104 family)
MGRPMLQRPGRPAHARVSLALAGAVPVATLAVAIGLGWDAGAWLDSVWHSFRGVSFGYIAPALVLQTAQTVLAATAWLTILRHAYPDSRVSRSAVIACYATGTALNGFLPANGGTVVTVAMLVATVPGATVAGLVAAATVEKVFFAVLAALVYVYLFVSVGGSFALKLGFVARHPWATVLVSVAAVTVVAVALRLAWRWLRRLWEQAKQGGKILGDRRAYVTRVAAPQLLSWCCKVGAVAVLLVAYHVPVSFHALMSVTAGNSLANAASLTPGGIGVSQALNVASLHHATSAARAAAYSVGHQLLTTAWGIVLAAAFLVAAFGWSAGVRLVKQVVRRGEGMASEQTS